MAVTRVILPKLGLTMDEGKLVAWHKREGDRVAPGDVLFEVETDKATLEVEATVGGVLRKVLVTDGAMVPVTTVVAYIADAMDEALPQESAAGVSSTSASAASSRTSPAASSSGTSAPTSGGSPPSQSRPEASLGSDGDRVRSSPAARKRAQELGVDINAVGGTGPGGRITLEDVERAASGATVPAGAAASAATTTAGDMSQPLSRMRRAIAASMTRSVTQAPQYSISRDVDMGAADELRKRAGVSYNDVIVAACAKALRAHARLRSRIDGDAIVTSESVNVGVAVALDDGLIVPVIHDADRLDLSALAAERGRIEAGAKAGKLAADALTGGVFSVSNLGTFGVDRFTAIVNPPEAAILAVGRVRDRVVARDGQPAVRPVVSLTLSVDHRVADGATAAAFLAEVAERLERGDA